MPSVSSVSSTPLAAQPASLHPPKSSQTVLAETDAQWIFTEEELQKSPSILDGMPLDKEREMRFKGVNFILQVGIMLKLPQVTITTAGVFFNRFLMRNTLVEKAGQKALHHYQIAATALFLASKVEENCRKMKELVVACCRVAQKNPDLIIDEQSKDYWRWRDTVLLNEDVLLESLCFDLTIDSPHKLLFEMLKRYEVENNKTLRNAAWAFLNDSGLTTLCLLFDSCTIAAAALYCAAKHCGDVVFRDDENGRPWWEVQHVKLKDIRQACDHMARIYENSPARKAGEPSIYVGLRTHEDDDEWGAKTRLRRAQTPLTPLGSRSLRRENSAEAVSERTKRDRESGDEHEMKSRIGQNTGNGAREIHEDASGADGKPSPGLLNGVPMNGQERSPKRAKTEINGTKAEPHALSLAHDELSEEGELEE